MENLIPFTIFGSMIAFGIALFILFVLLIVSDLEENGVIASVSVGILLGVNYFWGTFPTMEYLSIRNVCMYLFIGFLFSLIRTFFKGKELKKRDELYGNEEKKKFKLKEHVFRWWFLFPISILTWVFGRLLVDLYHFMYDKIETVYEKIFNM